MRYNRERKKKTSNTLNLINKDTFYFEQNDFYWVSKAYFAFLEIKALDITPRKTLENDVSF